MNNLRFLDSDVYLPFKFNAMLPFTEKDKEEMIWLKNDSRLYGIEEELKRGGRAIAYKGYCADEKGNAIDELPKIVLKLPNIDSELYTFEQIKDYLKGQIEEGTREWQLTHSRLYGCKYANPIFDYHVYQVSYLGEMLLFPVTAQLFLNDAVSLDDYLLNDKQRTQPYKSTQGIPYDNWNGMSDPIKWLQLAKAIATGLADIHQRRVAHGDIWPPNIFIRSDNQGHPYPIFIDFGESYPLEPKGISFQQRDHAYRAPERRDAQSVINQLADVYSFGKLLLHLAIGEEPILPSSYKGHERRERIREKFALRNPGIVSDNPFIIDIICQCISLDPIDRPNMSEVVRALSSYVDLGDTSKNRVEVSQRLKSISKTWHQITTDLSIRDNSVGPFLEDLVEQRMHDMEELVKGLSNDVVILNDTRERLILDLLLLFRRLSEGDRFISITNPRMWQGSCLGLDGRYLTATQLATVRGASIQRAFLVSIQELGHEWATVWAENLETFFKKNSSQKASKLAALLRTEIKKYLASIQQGETRELPADIMMESRQRLKLIVKSYVDAGKGICKNMFDRADEFSHSADCQGLYFGIIPVSTLSVMRTYKSAHPVSVFYYNDADLRDRYLLMMTDCLGRNSFADNEENIFDDIIFQRSKPELRGLTVFKSVLGVPEDRIKKLEQLFRQSVSVGSWAEQFYSTFPI